MMRFTSAIIVSLLLGACAMKNESFVNQQPLQVRQETASVDFSGDKISKAALDGIVQDVGRRATGPVTVKVSYDMKPPLNNSQRVAEAQGKRVKNYLVAQGIKRPVIVQLDPVANLDKNNVNISYEALLALAPKDCTTIDRADADQYSHGTDSDYRYGCQQDAYLSQMIARPADLLGDDTSSAPDSQRVGKVIDTYRSGEPATPYDQQNLSASQVYNSN